MTTTIATNVSADGDTNAVKVQQGRYLFALSGEFDGATVDFKVNIGVAESCPVQDMSYTASNAVVVWLPNCTVFATVSSAGASTDLNMAIARLALDVD